MNQKGTGVVLTGIHGRSETRIYTKGVEFFESNYPLSEEEKQVNKARNYGEPVYNNNKNQKDDRLTILLIPNSGAKAKDFPSQKQIKGAIMAVGLMAILLF